MSKRQLSIYLIVEVKIVRDRVAAGRPSGGVVWKKDGVIKLAKVLVTLCVRHRAIVQLSSQPESG